jgi:hypothetical protein
LFDSTWDFRLEWGSLFLLLSTELAAGNPNIAYGAPPFETREMIIIDSFNLAVSWGLTILIWLVQLIIYPGFHRVPPEDFVLYHRWYALRISVVVMPLMLFELVFLLGWWLGGADGSSAYTATLAVGIVWLSTFGLQVPIHKRLQAGKRDALIRRLVATNWIRTAAWSLKAVIVTLAIARNGL